MEILCYPPTPFLKANLPLLLPDWSAEEVWVIITLQQANCDLLPSTPESEQEKQRLRSCFIELALKLVQQIKDQGGEADFFDPKTGYPRFSSPGSLTHDDVATVQTILGYSTIAGNCRAIIHPQWGTAVYPGIIVTSLPVEEG
ncbi:methylmalonic aciduria and homocystinuria type D protein [Spirulina sp. CS-785/01]|uniref:methylmalonic aciduria and homocystinuria type D protein n=1 Tax=Spirulina sp. CS-785/01 TaxID=3021716 RepID=UPI00232E0F4B|nr:methylmalonic aciduria and homocystinuria type D protein [Spirulina sp. CS-785/01]MDB9312670.1 methylmalonic aciduria and homocystinuria type D protein [Spirulina sp. CS-785/01]